MIALAALALVCSSTVAGLVDPCIDAPPACRDARTRGVLLLQADLDEAAIDLDACQKKLALRTPERIAELVPTPVVTPPSAGLGVGAVLAASAASAGLAVGTSSWIACTGRPVCQGVGLSVAGVLVALGVAALAAF